MTAEQDLRLHSDARLRAFDIVDYVLYWLATLAFVTRISYAIASHSSTPDIIFSNFTILAFVTTVFLRNYVVMHAIDNRVESDDFTFVSYNDGWLDRFERTLRALIVFIVITTPEGVIDYITIAIKYLASDAQGKLGALVSYAPGLISAPQAGQSDINSIFPYYAVLLFWLFVLFIAWDVVSVLTISRGLKSGLIVAPKSSEHPETHDAVVALMIYCLLANRLVSGGKATIHYKESYRRNDYGQRRVEKGQLLRLYIGSPKFGERVFGLLAAVAILFCSVANYSLVSGMFLAGFVILYFVFARQNLDFWVLLIRAALGYQLWRYMKPRILPPIARA